MTDLIENALKRLVRATDLEINQADYALLIKAKQRLSQVLPRATSLKHTILILGESPVRNFELAGVLREELGISLREVAERMMRLEQEPLELQDPQGRLAKAMEGLEVPFRMKT